nr:Hypothetical protein FSTVLC9_86 [Faustovirus]
MDFSSFNPQPTFLFAIQLSAALFTSAVLLTLCALQTKYMRRSRTTKTSQRASQDEMYISQVDDELFNDIIKSYHTLTCMVPSDTMLEDDAKGMIISNNLDNGVIIFEVQDVYGSRRDMVDNDFIDNRIYPDYKTKYYYLVYARMFLTRTQVIQENEDGDTGAFYNVLASQEDNVDIDTSESEELPATAFYYAKVDDTCAANSNHRCGVELSMSAASSPNIREKEL